MATGTPKSALSALITPLVSRSTPNIKHPKLVYGTAWKKERSANLVLQALKAGFKGIDTAAQPRHYNEAGVAGGIKNAIGKGYIKREDLYLQTKFTSPSGQDPDNMPYSLSLPLDQQIHTSISSSLINFTFSPTESPYIDCLVLHSPLPTIEQTLLAWKTFESYVPTKIRSLGISNTSLDVLKAVYEEGTVKPSVVQNRFYPATNYDVKLRKYCREQGIIFQSFWTLTGNPKLDQSKVVAEMAAGLKEKGIPDEKAVALYCLVLGLEGIGILDGTTREERMGSDLASLEKVGSLIEGEWKGKWGTWLGEFKELIGEV